MEARIASWTTEDVKIWLHKNNLQKFENFIQTYQLNGRSLLVYDVHMFKALTTTDFTGNAHLPPALVATTEGEPIGWGENMEFIYHLNKLRQRVEEDRICGKNLVESKGKTLDKVALLVAKNLIKQILKKLIAEMLKAVI